MTQPEIWSIPNDLTIQQQQIANPLGLRTAIRALSPRPSHCDAMFTRSVQSHPGADAVVTGSHRLNYQQLNERVNAIASGLQASGLKPGERLVMLLNNHNDFISVLLACWRCNIIAVPVNVRLQTNEMNYIVNQCQASAMVFDADVLDKVPARDDVPSVNIIWQRNQSTSHDLEDAVDSPLQSQQAASPVQARSRVDFEQLLTASGRVELPTIDEHDTGLILYTSGTTGHPKGAMLSHFALMQAALQYQVCLSLQVGERSIMPVPASHVTGITANILSMLNVAGAVIILPSFDAQNFIECAARERITHTVMVPAMYNLCLLRTRMNEFDLSAWRVGGYGGAPMPEATIEALTQQTPGLSLANIYGATETTGPCTLMPFGQTQARSDSVGVATPCCDLKVIDPVTRTHVGNGEPGELWIRGPGVTTGYWNDTDATRDALIDGWWRSGDIASIDDAGYVRIIDRLKDLINRGGYKIYSIEVENALNYHPDVIESAAVAIEDPVLGEKVHAHVYTENTQLTDEHLAQHCLSRLADYKQPDRYTISQTPLPRNANGKILKRELRTTINA